MELIDRLSSTLAAPRLLRPIGPSAQPVAVIGRWTHPGGAVELGGIDTAQVILNLSGGQTVERRGPDGCARTAVRAGSVAVVTPGSLTSVAIQGTADTVQIMIGPALVGTANINPRAPDSCLPRLQAEAAQLIVALAQGSEDPLIESILRRILCLLCWTAGAPALRARGGIAPAARRRVQALIEHRFADDPVSPPKLADLAEAAGLSVHHFGRTFRDSAGETPHAQILRRQIEGSVALLLGAGARVDDIADTMGFSSPSHFVSAFRQRMGVTPGTLRDAVHALPWCLGCGRHRRKTSLS